MNVWILCYFRTGSSFLAEMLNATDLFDGEFGEKVQRATRIEIIERYKQIYEKGGRLIPQNHTQMCREHFEFFYNNRDKKFIESRLPGLKYILLRRRNLVKSGISDYFSLVTKSSTLPTEKDKEKYLDIPIPFDEEMVLESYYRTMKSYYGWISYLQGSKYIEFEHEDLKRHPLMVIGSVLDYLGLKYDQEEVRLKIEKRKAEEIAAGRYSRMRPMPQRPERLEYEERLRKILEERGLPIEGR